MVRSTRKTSTLHKLIFYFLMLFIFLTFFAVSQGIQWLAVGKERIEWKSKSKFSQCKIARKNYGFARRQMRICINTFEVMPYIAKAAEQTFVTCQQVFEKRRWNCSTILTAPNFTPDLTTGTREQAFVYALSSAAVTHSLGKGCASGSLHNCSCSGHPKDPTNGNFKWGGCGDNLRWGLQIGKYFTDSGEKRQKKVNEMKNGGSIIEVGENPLSITAPPSGKNRNFKKQENLALINLQNNRAGRKATGMSLKTQCKCHGVSGSCTTKICWKALPNFVEIGERLLKKYGTSVEVIPRKFGTDKKLVSVSPNLIRYNGDDLVYMTKSPDYCLRDDKTGSLGTVGRSCNRTSNDYNSCEIMCCGRGHQTLAVQKVVMCKCKFHWCCTVVCKKCLNWTDIHICN